jgi:hypothetical protein
MDPKKKSELRRKTKSLELFGTLCSPPMSPKELVVSSICNFINAEYPDGPFQILRSGICGIVDAQKIYQRRSDYLTTDLVFKVLNNHFNLDVYSQFKEDIVSQIDKDRLVAMTYSKVEDYNYTSQTVTIDRLLEILEVQVGYNQKDLIFQTIHTSLLNVFRSQKMIDTEQ